MSPRVDPASVMHQIKLQLLFLWKNKGKIKLCLFQHTSYQKALLQYYRKLWAKNNFEGESLIPGISFEAREPGDRAERQ